MAPPSLPPPPVPAGTLAVDQQKSMSHESGKTLMAHGPRMLHEYVSTKLEAALGHALPQMEVRFSNLSVLADIVVVEDQDEGDSSSNAHELSTVLNTVKKALASATKNQVRKEMLKNVSGCFKPGTMMLALSQPSSGKSSLMKILSGRFPMEKNITVEDEITYSSVAQQKIANTLPQFAAYVTQHDKHLPTLTAKETLEFVHEVCGGELTRRGEELLSQGTPAENQEALDAARAMFAHYPEIITEQLGLQDCQDTIVGDAMTRGISGRDGVRHEARHAHGQGQHGRCREVRS